MRAERSVAAALVLLVLHACYHVAARFSFSLGTPSPGCSADVDHALAFFAAKVTMVLKHLIATRTICWLLKAIGVAHRILSLGSLKSRSSGRGQPHLANLAWQAGQKSGVSSHARKETGGRRGRRGGGVASMCTDGASRRCLYFDARVWCVHRRRCGLTCWRW